MALARIHVWSVGEVLTANDLNNEFNNPLNNTLSMISPLTGNLDAGSFQLLNLRVENLGADPLASKVGRVFFNTGSLMLGVDDSNFIRKVPTIKSTTLQAGDIVFVTSALAFDRLGLGTSGQILQVTTSGGTGGGFAWSALAISSSVNITIGIIKTSQGGTNQDWSTAASGQIPFISALGTFGLEAQVPSSQGGSGTDLSAASTGSLLYVTSSGGWAGLPDATSSYRTLLNTSTGPQWSTMQLAYADSLGRVALGPGGSVYINMLGQVRCDLAAASRFVLPVGSNKFST